MESRTITIKDMQSPRCFHCGANGGELRQIVLTRTNTDSTGNTYTKIRIEIVCNYCAAEIVAKRMAFDVQ